MGSYLIQIIGFIIAIIIVLKITATAISLGKERHISNFSLEKESDEKSIFGNINQKFWLMINKLSDGLSKYKIINKLAKKYDKYILYVERNYKSNINYIAVKISLIIILVILSMIGIVTYILPNSILILVLNILIGYFIPDLIWQYNYKLRINKVNNDLNDAIKYINFSLQKNNTLVLSLNYAIENLNNPIKDELEKVVSDINYGLSISASFQRLYDRTKIKDIKIIYEALNVSKSLGIEEKETFKTILTIFDHNQKSKEKFNAVASFYNYIYVIALIIPLLVYIFGITINLNFFSPIFNTKLGLVILLALVITYLIYIFIMKEILEVNNE